MKTKFRYTGQTLATATVDSQDLVFGPGVELEVDPKNPYILALVEKGYLVRLDAPESGSPPTTRSPGRRAPSGGPPSKSKPKSAKPSKES